MSIKEHLFGVFPSSNSKFHYQEASKSRMKVTALAIALVSFGLAEAKIQTRCTQNGMYAMTWDDGPAQYTSQLLDILSSKGVKATFHITTQYITDPNIQAMVQRIAAGGHLIGLRTEADWDLFNMSDDQIRAGIARQANVLNSFIGYVPKFIRLPYNGFNDHILRVVESTGLIVTNYNLDTYDYTNDGSRTLNAVKLALNLKGKNYSFISIQHDGVQQSVAITPKIIDAVKAAGYKFVKLDECLGLGDMTKNKEQVKGADGDVDLGPMTDGGSGAMPHGGTTDGNHGGMMDNDGADGLAGQNAKNSSGIIIVPSFAAVMIAAVLALLL